MAFCATLDARLCSRESLVRIVSGAEESGYRRRLRSRVHQQLHTLGELWRFHLYFSSTTLASKEMSQMGGSLFKGSRRPISQWASTRLLYNHFAGHIRMN